MLPGSTLIGRFNHRILRTDKEGCEMYKLVTVYYDLDDTPTDYTEPGSCGCPSGLYDVAIESLEAFARPILDESDIDFSKSVLEKEDTMIGTTYQEKLWD